MRYRKMHTYTNEMFHSCGNQFWRLESVVPNILGGGGTKDDDEVVVASPVASGVVVVAEVEELSFRCSFTSDWILRL